MGTVTIGGSNFIVYGDHATALAYHQASLGDPADAWAAASDTKKDQSLVAATRMLDRQRWQGTPVGVPSFDTVLQWPRNGVTDRDGNAVSNAAVPNAIITATFELAAMLLDDAARQDAATSGSNVSSIGAGPAQASFFRPTLGQTGRFETRIQELVGQFLSGSVRMVGEAFGNDEETFSSSFDDTDTYGVSGAE